MIFYRKKKNIKFLNMQLYHPGEKYDIPNHCYYNDPKLLCRQHYFNALNFVVVSIQERFNQPEYQTYMKLQNLIIKSCKNKDISEEWKLLESLYKRNFNFLTLKSQLKMLPSFVNSTKGFSEIILEFEQLPSHKKICSFRSNQSFENIFSSTNP